MPASREQQHIDYPYPYLNHLLPTSITVPMVDAASTEEVDALLNHLPPSVLLLATDPTATFDSKSEPPSDAVEAAKVSLSIEDKRALLRRVLRSPQFHQALGTLTMALRDGGLPSVADALGVSVQNGGYMQQGGMPPGGGQALQAFVDGIAKAAKEQKK